MTNELQNVWNFSLWTLHMCLLHNSVVSGSDAMLWKGAKYLAYIEAPTFILGTSLKMLCSMDTWYWCTNLPLYSSPTVSSFTCSMWEQDHLAHETKLMTKNGVCTLCNRDSIALELVLLLGFPCYCLVQNPSRHSDNPCRLKPASILTHGIRESVHSVCRDCTDTIILCNMNFSLENC